MNCLDAETLAAWVDGGLSGAALEDVRLHVADCARCQALVGAMGRTRAAVPSTESGRSRGWWLAWAVPLTAAATAVAIWVAVPRHPDVSVTPSPTTSLEKREAPRNAAPAAPAVPALPTAEPIAPNAAPQRQARPAPPAVRDQPRAAAPEIAAPAPPPSQPATLQETVQLPAAGQRSPAADSQQTPAAAAPAARAAAAPPAAPVAATEVAQDRTGRSTTATNETATFRRVGPPAIEPLCGRGWRTGPADGMDRVTAGSSPSPNICWVVGRGGVVRRSTDRQTWVRVNFPETVDLAAVTASDSRNATITTVDGRSFRTVDGGVTWQQP